MTSLIACLGKEKGTKAHVTQLIEKEDWDDVFLITNGEKIDVSKEVNYIKIDSKKYIEKLVDDVKDHLKDKIPDTEVGLNLVSGTGKQHMAVLSAVLKIGLGIRLVSLTPEGVKEV